MAQQFGTPMEITSDDKLWALLAYVFTPIVPIIVLLMEEKKNRPFIKAHYMQALVYGALLYVVSILLSFTVILACIGAPLAFVGWIIAIYWGVQAYQGKYVTIPFITNFVKQQGWA